MPIKLSKTNSFILTIVIVFMITTALIVLFAVTADREVIKATQNAMDKVANNMELSIEHSIDDYYEDLTVISKFVSNTDINLDNAAHLLSSQSQWIKFNQLYYIDNQGNGISITNEQEDFSNEEGFILALKGENYIGNPSFHSDTGAMAFNLAVPVFSGNDITGVIYTQCLIDDFREIVIEATQNTGWAFLIDNNLNILFSTSLGHDGLTTIPEDDLKVMGMENVLNAQMNILSGTNDSFIYSVDYGRGNVDKVMIYTPIAQTPWTLAVTVEVSVINSDLATAVENIKDITKAIFFVLILLIGYFVFYRSATLHSLEKTAYYDPLTTLPNTAKIKKDMQYILSQNKTTQYGIIKVDVENFKVINEMFGFDIGNEVLKAPKIVSTKANEPSLIVARVGVDENLIFASADFISQMHKDTSHYESFYKILIPELKDYNLKFKYGRYIIPLGSTDVDDIINKVTLAHYMAKTGKGLTIYDYDDEYKAKILKDAEIVNKMDAALENNHFKVYLQPKFSLSTNSLVGAEALVRWEEEDGNMIMPNSFIPLFEKNGSITKLDMYVLDMTCATIRRWIDDEIGHLIVSVNFSRLHLSNPNFVEDIAAVLDKYNLPHHYIEIEVTESITHDYENDISELFDKIHHYGFNISIDDFGSGYSSLGMLKNLKVDTLKLDKTFFDSSISTNRSNLVVEGMINLAHKLGMYVVAEGIETEIQLATLRDMGCDAVQGYYYSKPIPTEEFVDKYAYIIPQMLLELD